MPRFEKQPGAGTPVPPAGRHSEDPRAAAKDNVTALFAAGAEGRDRDLITDPALRGELEAPPDTVVDLLAEVQRLRETLQRAVRLLARYGITPEEYQVQPLAERSAPLWREAVGVWEAAGVEYGRPPRVVLRHTTDHGRGERAFPTLEAAIEAAIADVEMAARYPESIEVDGVRVMDRAALYRAWEDRHSPD